MFWYVRSGSKNFYDCVFQNVKFAVAIAERLGYKTLNRQALGLNVC